jgi:predicted nucleic acid-binding protein
MRRVFVDTSCFYAHLNPDDPFHAQARELLSRAAREGWTLVTTNYVLVETLAVVQSRLGWEAVAAWQQRVLSHVHVAWVDETLHALGEARWSQARERRLSLTDCISFEYMRKQGIGEALAQDTHFVRAGFGLPGPCGASPA